MHPATPALTRAQAPRKGVDTSRKKKRKRNKKTVYEVRHSEDTHSQIDGHAHRYHLHRAYYATVYVATVAYKMVS